MNGNSTRRVRIEAAGEDVVAHVGLHALGAFADRLGVGDDDLDANRAWLAVVCFAGDLVRWFQLLCLTGHLARAEPKTLRWRLWHAPARLIRHARADIVRILDGWPDAEAIIAAHTRIAALT